jgi:hypothetical protein
MIKPVRIGNAQAFWGDRGDAAVEMLAREPDLDYLTMDYLAEVSMSILAMQRDRDPAAGLPGILLKSSVRSRRIGRRAGAVGLLRTPAASTRAPVRRQAAERWLSRAAARCGSALSQETMF